MNRTHFQHAGYALLIQLALTLIAWPFGAPIAGAWLGGFAAVWGFVMREHAHTQVDIELDTGVEIVDQYPLDGFRWGPYQENTDRWEDVLMPARVCSAAAVLVTVLFL